MTTYTDVFGGATIPATSNSYAAYDFSAGNNYLVWPSNASAGDNILAEFMDITSDAASGVHILLPDARDVSVGVSFVIYNPGSYDVSIYYGNAGIAAIIEPGTAGYFCLTDNGTLAGTWRIFSLGTGTSSVSAAALEGYGVKAITTSLNQSHPVTVQASGFTVTTAYRAKLVNYTGGADTVSFSPVATLGDDFFMLLRNSGTGTMTLNPDSSETIDGQTTLEVQPGESLLVVCSGTALFTVGYGRSILYNFTQLTKDVSAGGSFTLTTNEAANKLLTFTGNPGSNVTVIVPDTVAVYYILNSLSTAKSVTVKTSAGTGVAVSQSQRVIAISDATNVYSAQSVSASTSVQVVDGSAAAPAFAFSSTTNTGIYKYGVDGIGITVAGSPVFTSDSTSAALLIDWTAAGVTCADGGTFTTIDINGGTVDGVVIGGSSAAAGTFTTLTTTGNVTLGDASGDAVNINAATVSCANGLNFDSNTFVLDATNNRVGIGTSSPGEKLHIFGNAVDTAAKITKNGTDSALVGVDSEVYVGAGGALAFRTGGYTSAYDKAKLDASGNFLVGVSSATTNGGKIETSNGITFPATQSACSNANTLDDYEEGYHTPATVTCGTSGTVTLDSSYDTLSYTKIGRQITVSGNLAVASVSSPVGYFSISLPVAAASLNENSDRWPAVVVVTTTNAANAADFIGWASSSTLDVYLGDATAQQTDSANELKAGSNIWINVTYFTA